MCFLSVTRRPRGCSSGLRHRPRLVGITPGLQQGLRDSPPLWWMSRPVLPYSCEREGGGQSHRVGADAPRASEGEPGGGKRGQNSAQSSTLATMPFLLSVCLSGSRSKAAAQVWAIQESHCHAQGTTGNRSARWIHSCQCLSRPPLLHPCSNCPLIHSSPSLLPSTPLRSLLLLSTTYYSSHVQTRSEPATLLNPLPPHSYFINIKHPCSAAALKPHSRRSTLHTVLPYLY